MYSLTRLFNNVNSIVRYTHIGDDVSYALKREKDILYIYFEPSNGKTDWKHNFMFGKKPYKDMKIKYKVHRGFLKCWKQVEDRIGKAVIDKTIREIIIIGYSHGAALSMLCHEYCWFHRPDIRFNIWGIGFDSPRVYAGWKIKKELKERWNQYIMIKNHTDLVCCLPPWILGYKHVGHLLKIGQQAKYGPIKSHYPYNIQDSLLHCPYNTCWKCVPKKV